LLIPANVNYLIEDMMITFQLYIVKF